MVELSEEERTQLKKISAAIDKRIIKLDKKLITLNMQMLLDKTKIFFLNVWLWIFRGG